MSTRRITSKIEGNLTARTLLLEGAAVNLSPDGSGAFSATHNVKVIGSLDVACIVRSAASNTEWKLTVSEGANTLISVTRMIVIGNRDSFAQTVNLPAAPAVAATRSLPAGGAAKRGAATTGTAKKSAAKKSAAKKSAAKKGTAKKSAAKKGAGKKSATKKSAAKKSGKKGGQR